MSSTEFNEQSLIQILKKVLMISDLGHIYKLNSVSYSCSNIEHDEY